MAASGGRFSCLIKVLEESLADVDVYRRRFKATNDLSPAAQTVYRCFGEFPEKRVSAQEVCRETRLPRRTVVYSLSALTRLGLLQKFGKGRGVPPLDNYTKSVTPKV